MLVWWLCGLCPLEGWGGPRVTQRQHREHCLTVCVRNAQACSCFSMGPHVEMLLILYSASRQKTQEWGGSKWDTGQYFVISVNYKGYLFSIFNPHGNFYLYKSRLASGL